MNLKNKLFPQRIRDWQEFFDIASDSSTNKVNAKFFESMLTPPATYMTKFIAKNDEGTFTHIDFSRHNKEYQNLDNLKASKRDWTERRDTHLKGENLIESASALESLYSLINIGNYNQNADLNFSYKYIQDSFPFTLPFERVSYWSNRMNFDREGIKNLYAALCNAPQDESGLITKLPQNIAKEAYNFTYGINDQIQNSGGEYGNR